MKKIASLNITAHVRRRRGNNAKVRIVSDVTIRLDGKNALAFKTLGGSWNEQQALREFRKNPRAFQPQPGYDADMVAALAKAA